MKRLDGKGDIKIGGKVAPLDTLEVDTPSTTGQDMGERVPESEIEEEVKDLGYEHLLNREIPVLTRDEMRKQIAKEVEEKGLHPLK